MRKSWMAWWTINAFWVIVFSFGTIFIWTLNIDLEDAIQTTDAKMDTYIKFFIAFVIPFVTQIIWLIVNLILSNKKRNQAEKKSE